jgi:hypothetical protein
MDSGASHHMSLYSSSFTFVSPSPSIPVITAYDISMPLVGVGSIVTPHLSLPNVYLILKLRLNLASIGHLCDFSDYLVIFSSFFCCVQDLQSKKLIGIGRGENGLYILDEFAKIYINEVVQLHGIPVSIVSDRDPRFTFQLWPSIQHALGTRLDMSTTFHPQIDGQLKRVIQVLEHLLQACVLEFGGN